MVRQVGVISVVLMLIQSITFKILAQKKKQANSMLNTSFNVNLIRNLYFLH